MGKKLLIGLFALAVGFAGGLGQAAFAQGQWIGCSSEYDVPEGYTVAPARYVRKTVKLDGRIKEATMRICGLGLYEAWINGKFITADQVLSPTVSDYNKRCYYNTFDVTSALRKGRNAIAVVLGNGRFFSMRRPAPGIDIPPVTHYGSPMLWLEIDVVYADGRTEQIVSDTSWKITDEGPVRANNEFDGETYDARKAFAWTKRCFNDKKWRFAERVTAPAGGLQPQPNPNIAIQDRLVPVSITKVDDYYVLDMGQNMVGWLQVTAKGIAKGDSLVMRFAETLNDDGSLYMANLRGAKVTDVYVSKSKRRFTWHPQFVYHGFRYVEIKGLKNAPKVSDFEGQVFYDKMAVTGSFETSDAVINQVYKNAFWGIRGNYRGMPTDCPQRDERMGWFGDRATGCFGESYIFDNRALYTKWLTDIEDSQLENGHLPDVAPRFWNMDSDNMTWPGVYLMVADMLRERFGDVQPIIDHYDSMKKWMEYMRKNYLVNGIMTKDTYGDWCMPPESLELIHSQDPTRRTAGPVLSTAFYYDLLRRMARFAPLAGHPEDAAVFEAQAAESLKAFNKAYFKADAGCYDNNTVTANLLALHFGMVPQGREQDVFKHVVEKTEVDCNGHVSTGVIGIMFLMRTLTEYGRPDLALKIASNDTYPSWGYMARNGATTIWELWNGNTADPAMNSGNHVMLLGDLIIWEYEYLGGIRPLEPGYKAVELKPYPIKGLDWVNCSYDSVSGKIVSNWKVDGGKFEWDVEIPEGVKANVYIPAADGSRQMKEVGPGSHHFSADYNL